MQKNSQNYNRYFFSNFCLLIFLHDKDTSVYTLFVIFPFTSHHHYHHTHHQVEISQTSQANLAVSYLHKFLLFIIYDVLLEAT